MLSALIRDIVRSLRGRANRSIRAAAAAEHPGADGKGQRAPVAQAVPKDEDGAACYVLGMECYERGQLEAADRYLERAVELNHDFAEAHFARGLVLKKLSRFEEATDNFMLAACFKPDYAEAHYYLGLLAKQRQQAEAAADYYRKAIACNPGLAEAHYELASLLSKGGDIAASRRHLECAIAAKPSLAAAHNNLANLLFTKCDEVELALHHIQEALKLDPNFLAAHLNHSMLQQFLGRCEEAIKIAQVVLAQDPGNNKARFSCALAYLTMGDFEHGWPAFEVRKRMDAHMYTPRVLNYPEWEGRSLAGRAVLVHAEQGLGDEIMFASCLPDLMAVAGHCVIDCHEKLERIFKRSFPGASVHGGQLSNTDLSWLERVPQIDCKVACGTLPMYFRRRLEDFPQHAGYLRADPQRVAYWKGRLAEVGRGLKVGLSWRGGSKYTHRAIRSLGLKQLEPLLRMSAVQFVSLQYTDCRQELAELARDNGSKVHHWQEAIDDYDETAALVCALDLVISVQTAVVHLAGALGQPVWVMVSAASEWRYQRSGENLPWYPSVRIFRQGQLGHWQPVIERVAAELAQLMTGRTC